MTPVGPRWYALEVPDMQRPPLAEKADENLLVDFQPCPESELDDLDPAIPLPLALLAAEHDGRLLLVHNARSQEWELPLADIGHDETARAAAVRQFHDKTGSKPGEVEFVGVATVQLGHERRIEHVAVYRSRLQEVAGFEVTDDVDGLAWWDPLTEHEGLSPIDAELGRLALGA